MFPQEIYQYIFIFIWDIKTIFNLSCCCKLFIKLLNDSYFLKQKYNDFINLIDYTDCIKQQLKILHKMCKFINVKKYLYNIDSQDNDLHKFIFHDDYLILKCRPFELSKISYDFSIDALYLEELNHDGMAYREFTKNFVTDANEIEQKVFIFNMHTKQLCFEMAPDSDFYWADMYIMGINDDLFAIDRNADDKFIICDPYGNKQPNPKYSGGYISNIEVENISVIDNYWIYCYEYNIEIYNTTSSIFHFASDYYIKFFEFKYPLLILSMDPKTSLFKNPKTMLFNLHTKESYEINMSSIHGVRLLHNLVIGLNYTYICIYNILDRKISMHKHYIKLDYREQKYNNFLYVNDKMMVIIDKKYIYNIALKN